MSVHDIPSILLLRSKGLLKIGTSDLGNTGLNPNIGIDMIDS